MDLDDFWQENKRWVLGSVAGLLVFIIANAIVGDDGGKGRRSTAAGPAYTRKQMKAVADEKAALDATLAGLRATT